MPRLVSVAVPVPGARPADLSRAGRTGHPGRRRARARAARHAPRDRRRGPAGRGRDRPRASAPALKDVIDVFDAAPFVPRRRRRSRPVGGRVLRLRAGRGDRGRDAAVRLGRERVARAPDRGGSEAGGAAPRRGATDAARRHPGAARRTARGSPLRSIAYRLEHATPGRRGRAVPARAAVRALQADGLVEVDDVLERAGGGVQDGPRRGRSRPRARRRSPASDARSAPSSARRWRSWPACRRACPSPQLRERGVSYDVAAAPGRPRAGGHPPRSDGPRSVRHGRAAGRRRRRDGRGQDADRRAGRGLREASRPRRDAAVRRRAASRRDRQRQDRDLPPAGGRCRARRGGRCWCSCPRSA